MQPGCAADQSSRVYSPRPYSRWRRSGARKPWVCGPSVQEHVSVDPVEHRNGRKEQFAISPLRAGTPTARYLNRGCHCGAQARVENIYRPGSKLHLPHREHPRLLWVLEGYPRIAVQIVRLGRAGDEDDEQPAV